MKNLIHCYRLILLFAIFCICLQAQAKQHATQQDQIQIIPKYDVNIFNDKINKLYQNKAATSANLHARLDADSRAFLGQPYLLGALGEGPNGKFDKDPLYRTNGFDCLTFVSTMLALVESNNLDQFKKNILTVRYHNDSPSFVTRNHFTSVDWNPHNQNNGYIKDVTKQLFPKVYKIATADINRPAWFATLKRDNIKLFTRPSRTQGQELYQQLHGLAKQTKPAVSHLPYVPLTALYDANGKPNMQLFDRIPDAAIIEIVRPNWDLQKLIGTNLNISHLGLALRINGKLIYREASSIKHKVIDIPLTEYLKGYLDSKTVKGIHIEKIVLHAKA